MPQYQVYFDTLEGERKYNVDFGDEEPIEDVLRDIVGELSEKGHMMRGLSTGDLKVIWGGREGRELDLSQTLPNQGVRPNDVLRVLVEIYEGGGSTLRRDRIEKEWLLLQRLAQLNPQHLEILDRRSFPDEEAFVVRLRNSPGLESAQGREMAIRSSHSLRLCYTRFYPEVPIECYIEEALFHPNVKPETGFVCLWDQTTSRDTIVQAVARAQAMAALRMVNLAGPHVMNRPAAEWYAAVAEPGGLAPLTWQELRVYEIRNGQLAWLEPGRRLGAVAERRVR